MNRFTPQGFNVRIFMAIVYILEKVRNLQLVGKFGDQLSRSNALFLCRHEDTSSLRLFNGERSGRQMIRSFFFETEVASFTGTAVGRGG